MKSNKLTIQINKKPQEIFEFLLDPKNTPYWIDSIIKEEASEQLAKLGTVYKNINRNGKWSEYTIKAFEKNKMFIMTAKDKNYHVRYTLKQISDTTTKLEYYEWVDRGEIEEPFTIEILKKLKSVI